MKTRIDIAEKNHMGARNKFTTLDSTKTSSNGSSSSEQLDFLCLIWLKKVEYMCTLVYCLRKILLLTFHIELKFHMHTYFMAD